MTDEIRLLLDTQPFVPFAINVVDGREYRIVTPDHAHVYPNGKRVSIYTDDGLEHILPALLLSGLTLDEVRTEPSV